MLPPDFLSLSLEADRADKQSALPTRSFQSAVQSPESARKVISFKENEITLFAEPGQIKSQRRYTYGKDLAIAKSKRDRKVRILRRARTTHRAARREHKRKHARGGRKGGKEEGGKVRVVVVVLVVVMGMEVVVQVARVMVATLDASATGAGEGSEGGSGGSSRSYCSRGG